MHSFCGISVFDEKINLCIGTSAEPEDRWSSVDLAGVDEIWPRLEPIAKTIEWVFVQGTTDVDTICDELAGRGLPVANIGLPKNKKLHAPPKQLAIELARNAAKEKYRWPAQPWRYWQLFFLLPPLLIAFAIERLFPALERGAYFILWPLYLAPIVYMLVWFRKNPKRTPAFLQVLVGHHPSEEVDYQPVVPQGCLSAWWLLALPLAVALKVFHVRGVYADILFCAALAVLAGWGSLKLGRELRQAALPVTMVILFGLILQTNQSEEVLRVVNESSLYVRMAVYFGWLLLLGFLSLIMTQLAWRGFALPAGGELSQKQKVVAGLSAASPYVVAIVSAWNALTFNGVSYLPNPDWVVFYFILIAVGLAGAFIFLSRDVRRFRLSMSQTIIAATIMFVSIFNFGNVARAFGYNVELSEILLLTGWFSAATAFFYLAGKIGRMLGVPAIRLMLIWAILLSALDLNNNHELSYARTNWKPPSARDAFDEWLGRFAKDAPSPTAFVVVSEGGGARAEYLTAVVLQALRARCTDFNNRHFATIGVSGGSVGAALSSMSELAASPDCNNISAFKADESVAVAAAGLDLLGPALRGFLLKDLPYQLLPNSLWRTQGQAPQGEVSRTGGDRSQYMEEAIGRFFLGREKSSVENFLLVSGFMRQDERHKAVRPENYLFSAAWDGPTGNRPGLILLATDVATGRRVAASHFRFAAAIPSFEDCLPQKSGGPDPAGGKLLSLSDIMPGREPTLLGAALASARFPIISPAAALPCTGPTWSLVDGGYFENSGLTTALELVENMAAGAKQHGLPPKKVNVVLIRLENGEAITQKKDEPGSSFSEYLSPLRAFGGTREARAELARSSVDQAANRGTYGTDCDKGDGACINLIQVPLKLAPCPVTIPLAWSLSDGAKAEIRQQLGIEPSSSTCVGKIGEINKKQFERIFELSKN